MYRLLLLERSSLVGTGNLWPQTMIDFAGKLWPILGITRMPHLPNAGMIFSTRSTSLNCNRITTHLLVVWHFRALTEFTQICIQLFKCFINSLRMFWIRLLVSPIIILFFLVLEPQKSIHGYNVFLLGWCVTPVLQRIFKKFGNENATVFNMSVSRVTHLTGFWTSNHVPAKPGRSPEDSFKACRLGAWKRG